MTERRLGNRLREARSSRNLTQADLAAQIGVSRKTINTVENGVFVPSTTLALALAQTLELRVEDLFYLIDG
ncbi:MAG TPA: helix-turn-helix transcriptional regulator [Rhizomicrobium sp.]